MEKLKSYSRTIIAVILVLITLCSCSKPQDLLERDDWSSDVKIALNELITKNRNKGKYVVFDFDNTCSIFDIEEQTVLYQLETMSFAIEPGEMEKVLKSGLTKDYQDIVKDICTAYLKLWDNYGPFTAEGLSLEKQKDIQKDIYWKEFATKIRYMYDFIYDRESASVAYPWIIYWFSGMTESQIYNIAYKCIEKYSKVDTYTVKWESPMELESKFGTVSIDLTYGINVSENIKELWRALYTNGIDVWVCSASYTEVIKAAVDYFSLHDYCKGLLAMTIKADANGRRLSEYDYETGYGYFANKDGKWDVIELATKAQTQGIGKVFAIQNAIMPLYNNNGPIAGFMDSTGDFNFCTEFSSLQLVVCFNRANRSIKDGGGLIAELSQYQKNDLGYNFKKANENGDTFYVLQGRNENGLRLLRNSEKTIRYGKTTETLYKNQENVDQYEYMKKNKLTTKQILDTFALNFLTEYNGYHSR